MVENELLQDAIMNIEATAATKENKYFLFIVTSTAFADNISKNIIYQIIHIARKKKSKFVNIY